MGKATIVSGGDGGKYVIKLDYGKEAKEKRLAQYTARLAELTALIDTQQGKIDTQQGKIDEANAKLKAAQDAVIAAHQAMIAPDADQGAATKATTAAIKAWAKAAVALEAENRKMAPLKLEMQLLKDEQAQLKKDKDKWEALQLEEKKEAWCADLTEDATGEVATIEIPGEDLLVLIAPEAKPPVATDGILTAREVQSSSQVFFNAAILPGWQRWTPTYRRGVIDKINEDETVNVTLTNDRSSAQNLVINKAPELFSVPVKYMTCDVSAFEVGDACVIKFTDHDWDKPTVVGFVDNPKLCSALHGIQASETHYGGSDVVEKPSSLWAVAYGKDMPEEPKPVSVYSDHPGHITWSSPHFKIGSSRVELSWRGPDDRYSRITNWTKHTGGYISWMIPGTPYFIEKIGAPTGPSGSIPGANCYIDTKFVWINGRRVDTTVEKVIAAALHRPNPDEPGGVVLRVLSDSYPQRTGTRRFCTFDLIPSDASGPVSLSAIVAATSFNFHATWPATLFHPALPEAGTWYNEQRPHFDNRGERVATSIIKQGEQTRYQVHAVSLDPVTWQILEEFSPLGQNTDSRTSSAQVTGTKTTILYPSGFELVKITSVSFQISRTYNANYYVLYAVDFFNDDFVYVYHEMQSSGSEYESGSGSITSGGVYSGADTYSKSNTISLTVNHSIHGVIAQRSHTSTKTGGVGFDGENATISSTTDTEFIWDNTQLCADLSQNVYAIGVPLPNKYEINYSGPAEIIDNRHSDELRATVNVTTTKSQIEYSVFMGGAAVASGTNGNYDMPPNPDVSETTFISDGYPTGMMMVVNNNVSLPHSYNITSPTYLQSFGTINAINEACKNIAVRADGKAAYFGVNARDVGGLELLVVKSKDGTETDIKEVPPYIDGTHPTIACPVFGSRRK